MFHQQVRAAHFVWVTSPVAGADRPLPLTGISDVVEVVHPPCESVPKTTEWENTHTHTQEKLWKDYDTTYILHGMIYVYLFMRYALFYQTTSYGVIHIFIITLHVCASPLLVKTHMVFLWHSYGNLLKGAL